MSLNCTIKLKTVFKEKSNGKCEMIVTLKAS